MPSLKTLNPAPKITKANSRLLDFSAIIDSEDPEYQRQVLRPAEIKEDVKLMENRKRVSQILRSESFRRDLEEIVKLQLQSGPYPDDWAALQSLSDFLVPHAQYGVATSTFSKGLYMPAMPINDVRKGDSTSPRFDKAERILRCKLASVFRLVDIFGWSSGMNSCITLCVGREFEHMLINPFGLLFHEITASSLVKIDMNGSVIDSGSTGLQVGVGSWYVPSAIYAARPDIRCVILLRNPATVAVSAMKCGLLPLSQEAMICGPVALYDPYATTSGSEEHSSDQEEEDLAASERDAIGASLGNGAKILIIRSHGLYACGSTVEEAWHFAFNAMAACQAQLKLLPLGIDKIIVPSKGIQDEVFRVGSQKGSGGVEMHGKDHHDDTSQSAQSEDAAKKEWRVGELEFEALMRQLDHTGYRTGYLYRPQITDDDVTDYQSHQTSKVEKGETSASEEEVSEEEIVVPPAASSYVKSSEEKASTLPAGVFSAATSQWSNTPNAYKKQEIDEIGTPHPKKITHWVAPAELGEEKQTSGLSEAIISLNQFAPQGVNPKELKEHQQKVKENYFNDTIQAGPQSKLLEGITYEEARKLQEAREGKLSGDHVVIVGAVSKGIIQREHRHNVSVYQSVYSTNPFQQITDDDLRDYQRQVRRKNATPEELARIEAEELAEKEAMEKIAKENALLSLHVGDTTTAEDTSIHTSPVTTAGIPSVESTHFSFTAATEPPSKSSPPPVASGSGLSPRVVSGRTDTSEADVTTHTEVTDTEGKGDGKEKKKKKRFKMPSFSRKSKDKQH